MAKAIPVSDMMFDEIPNALSNIKAVAIAIGIWIRIIKALRQFNKKIMTIIDTTIISSNSVCFTDFIASSISPLRSYAVLIVTPSGNPF